MRRESNMERLALCVGVVCGVIVTVAFMGFTAPRIDPDLQKIQRQRDAMRLYEEASK